MKNYIVFEGNEGVGKTTLSKNYAKHINAKWTCEPGKSNELLKTLRNLATQNNDQMTKIARELILIANRDIHLKTVVEPLLHSNIPVVSDRSFISGYVYSAFECEDDSGFPVLKTLIEWDILNKDNTPSIVVFVKGSNDIEKIENDRYDNLSQDKLKDIDNIFNQVIGIFKEHDSMKIVEFTIDKGISEQQNLDNLLIALGEKL